MLLVSSLFSCDSFFKCVFVGAKKDVLEMVAFESVCWCLFPGQLWRIAPKLHMSSLSNAFLGPHYLCFEKLGSHAVDLPLSVHTHAFSFCAERPCAWGLSPEIAPSDRAQRLGGLCSCGSAGMEVVSHTPAPRQLTRTLRPLQWSVVNSLHFMEGSREEFQRRRGIWSADK